MKGSDKLIAGILLGAAAGAGLAYFLTTDKGKELLANLKQKAEGFSDEFANATTDAKQELNDLLEKGKAFVADLEKKINTNNT